MKKGITGSFIILGGQYSWPEDPRHPLDIPTDWAQEWDGDFSGLEANDFMDRDEAIAELANKNRKELARKGGPSAWWLLFEIGELDKKESFVNIANGAAADFSLKASVFLVRPTAAEIKRLAGKSIRGGKRGAA